MRALERVYWAAPHLLKGPVMSARSHWQNRIKYGTYYQRGLHLLRSSERWSADEYRAYQLEQLKRLLCEAYEFSPYYRSELDNRHLPPIAIQGFTDADDLLARLPSLDKHTLRSRLREIVSTNPARPQVAVADTSGSTGTPLRIPFDSEGWEFGFAVWRRFYDWMGLPEKFRNVRFSGRLIVRPGRSKPPFWVHDAVNRRLFMSSYHLHPANLSRYVAEIDRYKPDLIDGYPSAIHVIAQHILTTGVDLSFRPAAVVTTAETLLDYQRAAIQEAFRCRVYNQYASSEGAPMIAECECGSLHLYPETGMIEVTDPLGRQVPPGEIGELIVTSFLNYKTPLVRYRIGDYVRLASERRECSCGRKSPTIGSITGREDEMLFTSEKGFVGRLDPAYKGLRGIVKSQIVQTDPECILVRQVVDGSYNDRMEERLIQNLQERLGRSVNIRVERVTEIPLGANGKFKAVLRTFSLGKLGR